MARGQRGSTEEHLTVTQFKVAREQQRLEDVTVRVERSEQALADAVAAARKKQKELQMLQKQTQEMKSVRLSVQDIEQMGKTQKLTGNIVLTPYEWETLKAHAVNGLVFRAENARLKVELENAKNAAARWKQKFEALQTEVKHYLEAVKLAPERVRAFLSAILAKGKETHENATPARKHVRDIDF